MSRLPCPTLRIAKRQDAESLFAALAAGTTEAVAIAYLGSERSLLGLRHVMGHADSARVPLTHIVRDAILFSARGVLIAHNHPCGDPAPAPPTSRSPGDWRKGWTCWRYGCSTI
ncbi:hypothetical protein SPKIRA_18870 [Sphingomonas paucimobilis]|nr:JAB domain-containing protein [Sphingomonas paucimobilis]BCI71057.1 hypothetical protein SPKIRA_18870 [Sphingomonas paucimobilis]